MELLTKELQERLEKNGLESRRATEREDREPDHFPVVKLFDPCGASTWLLTELDPETPSIAFGLCDLGMGCPELGSVSLYEIESVLNRFGLRIERDLHWKATHPISVYARAAHRGGCIVTDAASLDAAVKAEVA